MKLLKGTPKTLKSGSPGHWGHGADEGGRWDKTFYFIPFHIFLIYEPCECTLSSKITLFDVGARGSNNLVWIPDPTIY